MGAVHFSLDKKIVSFFKEHFELNFLVETGTFKGDTIEAFINDFDNIFSVEFSEQLFEKAINRFEEQKHVNLNYGDSGKFISQNRALWSGGNVLYWLDAHWCEYTGTAGAKAQCPLLQELEGIEALSEESIVMIDDARLFLCSPPGDHELSQWPDIDSVINSLRSISQMHRIAVVDDTIVFYPTKLFDEFRAFCQSSALNVLSAWDKSRDYDLLLVQLKEKEVVLHDMARQLEEKEAVLLNMAKQLEAKEALIHTQDGVIRSLQSK